MRARRALIVSVVLALVSAGLVWNLVFDLWLGQVERQYLWEQARHELGYGPAVSLKQMVAQATREAGWVAAGWALFVALSVVGAAAYSYRQGRQRD
jgi:hypothetical protein